MGHPAALSKRSWKALDIGAGMGLSFFMGCLSRGREVVSGYCDNLYVGRQTAEAPSIKYAFSEPSSIENRVAAFANLVHILLYALPESSRLKPMQHFHSQLRV